MQHHWAHFLAVSASFLAIAIIVSVATWSHATSTSQLYSAVQVAHHDGSAPGEFFVADITSPGLVGTKNSAVILALGREGARWAHNVHNEATIWAIVVLILLVFVLLYHFWQTMA